MDTDKIVALLMIASAAIIFMIGCCKAASKDRSTYDDNCDVY